MREGYRIGVNFKGFYREILNTDSAEYGGGNVGNMGGLNSQPQSWHGRPHSLLITLPPLAIVAFKRE